ncbi:DUF4129 domain-containing protein [Lacisediminihabitans changchengi]|uniref:DUF4129 domain-containing protein n=1 Tax=Lacisediminihabitans changchengi TaxID=2787634 RepID=A0A934SIV5_9MICO|nr:DUF4129 domain-containing protein [Lacisediminihabitans changchengi]MBK4346408.1 DUF4129 domain-containing protein [Lacisediminihabitans changchengi]
MPLDVPLDVPVNPDAGQARDWIIAELTKPEYRAPEPTWFDRLSQGFLDWLGSLKFSVGGAAQGPLLFIVGGVLVAAAVTAYLIFGPPRLGRRSAIVGSLFGQDDSRDAAAMRRAAADAAGREDYTLAIEEQFRAIARALAERTVLTVSPGTTARDFSGRAGASFPSLAGRLATAAETFDAVRYLGRPGTRDGYLELTALDTELRGARPLLAPVGVG